MKLQFDANQQFQLDAIAAITDLFEGQPQGAPEFSVMQVGDLGGMFAGQERTDRQERRFGRWIDSLGDARLAIVEIGAGTAVPTVRITSENLGRRPGATLIRINVREPRVPADHIGTPMGGLEALLAIEKRR